MVVEDDVAARVAVGLGPLGWDACRPPLHTLDAARPRQVGFFAHVRHNLVEQQDHRRARHRVEGLLDRPRIVGAAAKSGADLVIRALPQQYDTTLGRWFAQGRDLSGGEWQKIALARAFMRDCEVLVLDEPTAALDAENELKVFQQFRELTSDKTAVLISHRFSTVRMADRIFVIEDGHVSEEGTHNELLAVGGTYARLFNLQAESYR